MIKQALVLSAWTVLSASAFAVTKAEIPPDLEIGIESGSPDNYARWSGCWEGKWAVAKLHHIFIVEEINAAGTATVVYSHGSYPDWGIEKGEYSRWDADFIEEGKRIRLPTFRNGADVTYKFKANYIEGRYVRSNGVTKGRFTKIECR